MLNKWINFADDHVTEGQFQWFIDVVAYLQFVTGGTVIPRESKLDDMDPEKSNNNKDQ